MNNGDMLPAEFNTTTTSELHCESNDVAGTSMAVLKHLHDCVTVTGPTSASQPHKTLQRQLI